jgi:hypothetical protein
MISDTGAFDLHTIGYETQAIRPDAVQHLYHHVR